MKKKVIQFNYLFAFLGISTCIYSTFIMPYLKMKGFTITELGIFSSINITMAILGQFIFGYLCDAAGTIKKIFIFNVVALLAIALTMELNSKTALVIGFIAAIGFFQGPLSVLSDSWVLSNEKAVSENFGGIRAWASIGWAVCSIFMGIIIDYFGWKSFFICYMLMLLVTLSVTMKISDVKRTRKLSEKRVRVNPFVLFKDYRYVFVVLIMLLLTTTHQTMSFLYVKINSLGGTSKQIGISAFVMASCELPVFFGAKRLTKKYRLTSLLLFCSSMYIIRMVLLGIASTYTEVIVLGILQMFTFAVYVIAYKYFIVGIAPDNLQVTAQSVATSICAIGSIIFSSAAGYLIDKHGINTLYLVGAVTSTIATILICIYTIFNKKARME